MSNNGESDAPSPHSHSNRPNWIDKGCRSGPIGSLVQMVPRNATLSKVPATFPLTRNAQAAREAPQWHMSAQANPVRTMRQNVRRSQPVHQLRGGFVGQPGQRNFIADRPGERRHHHSGEQSRRHRVQEQPLRSLHSRSICSRKRYRLRLRAHTAGLPLCAHWFAANTRSNTPRPLPWRGPYPSSRPNSALRTQRREWRAV